MRTPGVKSRGEDPHTGGIRGAGERGIDCCKRKVRSQSEFEIRTGSGIDPVFACQPERFTPRAEWGFVVNPNGERLKTGKELRRVRSG
jgi:hypothetical protein